MQPELFSCCSNSIHFAPWIFIYENKEIYSICDEHFASSAHRAFVKYVITTDPPSKLFLSEEIFREALIEKM